MMNVPFLQKGRIQNIELVVHQDTERMIFCYFLPRDCYHREITLDKSVPKTVQKNNKVKQTSAFGQCKYTYLPSPSVIWQEPPLPSSSLLTATKRLSSEYCASDDSTEKIDLVIGKLQIKEEID